MSEAHYLDRKGFNIPPLALQVALQEDEYRAWTESLERLLDFYYQVHWGNHSGLHCTAVYYCTSDTFLKLFVTSAKQVRLCLCKSHDGDTPVWLTVSLC